MYLLDTRVLSEIRKARAHGAVLAWVQSVADADLYLSAVKFGEIQSGNALTREQDAAMAADIEARADMVTAACKVLPADAQTFQTWARLLHRRCDSVYQDTMIAATAAIHFLTVVGRKPTVVSEFGVRLFNPFVATPRGEN